MTHFKIVNFTLSAAAALLICSGVSNVDAQSRRSTRARLAPVCIFKGLSPLGQYATQRQYQCFKTKNIIETAGFVGYSTVVQTAPKSPIRKSRFPLCGFVGIRGTKSYFNDYEVHCFSTEKRAKKAGFIPLDLGAIKVAEAVTPSPTIAPNPISTATPSASKPTPTPLPDAPTATPTATSTSTPSAYPPSGDPITYEFDLLPYQGAQNAGYTGHCRSTISGDRHRLDIDCTHNVPNAFSAHLHVIPLDEPFCNVLSPGMGYHVAGCEITGDVARGVMSGPALIAIHSALGGGGQALDGYYRPLP